LPPLEARSCLAQDHNSRTHLLSGTPASWPQGRRMSSGARHYFRFRPVTVDLRGSVTAVTLRHPGTGLVFTIRGDRPGWWTELGQHLDLTQFEIVEVTLPAHSLELGPAEPTPSPTPLALRPGLIASYRERHLCTIQEIAARANVTPRALRGWRSGDLPDRSAKSIRIEALLQRGLRSD